MERTREELAAMSALGVNSWVWDGYTEEQKQDLLSVYRKRTEELEAQSPASKAMDAKRRHVEANWPGTPAEFTAWWDTAGKQEAQVEVARELSRQAGGLLR